MAVVVDLLDLPAMFPLALANPVIDVTVIGHITRRERDITVLCPGQILHAVGLFVPGCPILGQKALHLDRKPSIGKRPHRTRAGQVHPLAEVIATVAGLAVGQLGKFRPRHHGRPR